MKFEYQDTIDRYVRGEMSTPEQAAFEKKAEVDDELRDQLLYTQEVKNQISSRAEKLAKMQEWMAQESMDHVSSVGKVCASNAPVISSTKKKVWYWSSGIAAVFVIGVFISRTLFVEEPTLGTSREINRGGNDVFAPVSMPSSSFHSIEADSLNSDTINVVCSEE